MKLFEWQEIAFNIRQTEAMTKNLSPSNAVDCNDFASLSHNYDAHSLRRNKNISQENHYQRNFVEQVSNLFSIKIFLLLN